MKSVVTAVGPSPLAMPVTVVEVAIYSDVMCPWILRR